MAPFDDSDVIRVLEGLALIDPNPETIGNTIERTRSALKSAAAAGLSGPSHHARQRRISFFARPRGVLVAVALLLAGLAIWLWPGNTDNAAFAQMQKSMDHVATVAMTCEFEAMNGRKQADQRVMLYDGDRQRIEFLDGDSIKSIWIIDLKRNATLMLMPATKQWLLNEKFVGDNEQRDHFTRVRQYRNGNVKQRPEREIGGKRMLCFEVNDAFAAGNCREDWTVLADPDSKLPERIESVVKDLKGKILIRYVCKDFSFEPLDESLFLLEPPEGYEKQSN